MTSQNTKAERSFDKLGLPPMELAETTCNVRSSRESSKYLLSLMKKLIVALLLALFGAGAYILLLKLIENNDSIHSTEIIVVTGIRDKPNITLQDMEIILRLKNNTDTKKERKKRNAATSTTPSTDENIQNSQENKIKHIKETIARYSLLCHHDNEIPICKELFAKLKTIAERDHTNLNEKNDLVENISRINLKLAHTNSRESKGSDNEEKIHVLPEKLKHRELDSMGKFQNILESLPHADGRDNYAYGYGNPINVINPPPPPTPHLTDTCLLAKLLKHNYPHLHGLYDVPASEYVGPHYVPPLPHTRYYPPSPSNYIQGRDTETTKSKLHPQDMDILMSFLTPNLINTRLLKVQWNPFIMTLKGNDKHVILSGRHTRHFVEYKQPPDFNRPEVTSKDQITNSSARETICSAGSMPCGNGEDCVSVLKWCDGNVDCPDASDEARCACKHRVDKSRLCDGYFDCPFGEDEMGCFGCDEDMFSCENFDSNSQTTCFSKEQKCDNHADCPNQRDEVECNMLAPSLHEKPLFAISNTEGYLHRNFKGDWYAVCKNPYMWAHDACRRETGIIIRPPFIQHLPVDPLVKINYLNTDANGLFHKTDTCFNSSAVYVTCLDLLCGTRVLSTSQMLRENAVLESQIFGRNKRFLMPNHPYPLMFYGSRKKRNVYSFQKRSIDDNIFMDGENILKQVFENMRNRRAEGRVVGGRPSQPAAWPWMVAIYRNGMFHCGGVVLTQNWVMSAAHCVHKFWEHYYEIQVGMLRRFSFSPQEHNHKVTHIIVNQHYRQQDMKNDLSLLRVEPVIQFSRWVRPVCLPGPDTAGPDWLWGPPPGTKCTAVGWGATVEHGPDPDHMREVVVPIWEKCKHRDDRAGKEICAGPVEGGKDACQGDSGGPLLCRNPLNSQQWHIAGIVSHGDGCARKDEPGVYTRVSLFVKWIRYHISSKSLPMVQPLQDCPGFKCKSGISKCIPHKRKCDKIIDCLGGEDEVDCDFTKKASNLSGNILLNELMFKSSENDNNTEVNRITKGAENSFVTDESVNAYTTINSISNQNIRIETTTNPNVASLTSTTNQKSTEDKTENINEIESNFEHASTLEIPFSLSSEDTTNTNTPELTTTNILVMSATDEVDITSTDNSQSITVSFPRDSFEFRSSILQNDIDQETDGSEHINESLLKWDWTTEGTSPTELSTMNLIEDDTESLFSNFIESTTSVIKSFQQNKSLRGKENHDNDNDPIIFLSNDATENKSEELLIKLLPTTEASEFSLVNNDFDDNENDISHMNTEPSVSHNSSKHNPPKQLTDFEDKKDIIHRMEEIVFSELPPPSIRRKHRIPKEFECGRITQVIPYHQRCNQKPDCEDGTDEIGCTCIDYLSTLDEKLLCDGHFDCADGQDEIDCFSCQDEYFLCKRSHICLPMKHVCDGKSDCPQGEDELDCFALSNGKELQYDIDERPQINVEGYVTKRHEDEWHIVCEDTLSLTQIEETANHICHYLGFRSANRYFVKYINIKEDQIKRRTVNDKRKRRETDGSFPVNFAYRKADHDNESIKHIVIQEPQVIPEQCVPNITKTCKSLYVFCDQSLFTDFGESEENFINRATVTDVNKMWPWVAKIYVDGNYKCTGVLIDLSWVLISNSCLWDTNNHNFITVILGAQRILSVTNGPLEQIYQVDAKKDLYRNKVILLHLKEPAKYSNMVKPMLVSSSYNQFDKNNMCVAVGQDGQNRTVNVFLEETKENCTSHNICFKRKEKNKICGPGMTSDRQWAGIITCHTEQGWYPVASFVDSRGECGLGTHILATDIENLKNEIRHYSGEKFTSHPMEKFDSCGGHRCSRGRCIGLHEVCDGVRHCEDGTDESAELCNKKHTICEDDPFATGCECASGQMKCRNGKCISKALFRDGHDDCGDGTDEPGYTTCSDYLARVMPSNLCDGILHCHDRSDEDPVFCKCYAKKTYKCGRKTRDGDRCVAPDMVCDGIRDCPNGEDEQSCIGLSAPEGTPYGTGQVVVRSHGVWHSKCYTTSNYTKTELQGICKELGFMSGHAKEIKDMNATNPYNNLILDTFNEVVLNNNTIIKMRNTHEPLAKAVFSENLQNCYPVFIECL